MSAMLERVRLAWRSVRPPDALAAAFLCLLLARKSCTGALQSRLQPALSSAAAAPTAAALEHVCSALSSLSIHSATALEPANEQPTQQTQQSSSADVEANALLLVLLGLAELRRIRDLLQQPGGLEAVATLSPPYCVLTTLRYLLAFVFPEQCAHHINTRIMPRTRIISHTHTHIRVRVGVRVYSFRSEYSVLLVHVLLQFFIEHRMH